MANAICGYEKSAFQAGEAGRGVRRALPYAIDFALSGLNLMAMNLKPTVNQVSSLRDLRGVSQFRI
ncbi:MAG: hypothetical protein LBB79_08330 [Prevotellaceae bacterium]|nr:hypothetical protein [Prevotellaceae bacterium]